MKPEDSKETEPLLFSRAILYVAPDPIVTTGDAAEAVFDPVPVTSNKPVQGADGVVNVADHAPPLALNPDTVDAPEHPPAHVALVNPDGAATA